MMITKKLIEAMTMEVLELLCSGDYNELWFDTSIYSNEKMYTTHNRASSKCLKVNGRDVYVLEDISPNFSQFLPDDDKLIFSMTFEGALNQVINLNPDYALPDFMERFNAIFNKYEVFYEQLEAWNLTCFPI